MEDARDAAGSRVVTIFFYFLVLISLFSVSFLLPLLHAAYARPLHPHSSVHQNKAHKAVRHLTPFHVLFPSLGSYRNLPDIGWGQQLSQPLCTMPVL